MPKRTERERAVAKTPKKSIREPKRAGLSSPRSKRLARLEEGQKKRLKRGKQHDRED